VRHVRNAINAGEVQSENENIYDLAKKLREDSREAQMATAEGVIPLLIPRLSRNDLSGLCAVEIISPKKGGSAMTYYHIHASNALTNYLLNGPRVVPFDFFFANLHLVSADMLNVLMDTLSLNRDLCVNKAELATALFSETACDRWETLSSNKTAAAQQKAAVVAMQDIGFAVKSPEAFLFAMENLESYIQSPLFNQLEILRHRAELSLAVFFELARYPTGCRALLQANVLAAVADLPLDQMLSSFLGVGAPESVVTIANLTQGVIDFVGRLLFGLQDDADLRLQAAQTVLKSPLFHNVQCVERVVLLVMNEGVTMPDTVPTVAQYNAMVFGLWLCALGLVYSFTFSLHNRW
jgi:hypothetical protein